MNQIKQGYKQTKVGIIPDDWEIVKLGKLTTVETGKTPLRSNKQFWDNGTINWATTTEVNETYIVSTNEKITNQAVAELKMKILPINTILLAMYGQGKTRGKVALLRIESTINQAFASIKPNKNYSTNFIFNYLDKSYEKIRDLSHGSNQDNLNLDIVKALQIPLPPLKEQEKIAEILTTWDEAITKQTELLEAKELLKIALMQKLLSGEVRFSGFSDEWHFYKLGYLLDYEQPTNYLVNDTNYDDSFNTPVLTAGKTFILGYTNETDGIYKEQLPVIIFDDFTTATQFVNFPFKAKSSAMKILKSKGNLGNIKVIFELMQTIKYQADDHKRYWISEYQDLEIKLPSLPEQQKIAEVLSLADDEIILLKNELEELKLQKKALMQKLLTGEVRVKV